MTDAAILNALKFLGLAIGLATTVWGLTRKTTFDDGTGQKRLTPAGHMAVALALGSFLIAGASQGFETLAKQAAARASAIDVQTREEREFRRDALASQREQARKAASANEELLTLAMAGQQRILILSAANKQRERDLGLARQVNEGSQRNLARAQFALAQLERLLQPIEGLRIRTEWAVVLEPSNPTLSALIGAVQRAASTPPPGIKILDKATDGTIRSLEIDQTSEYYKRLAQYRDVSAYVCLFSHDVKVGDCPEAAGLAVEVVPSAANEHPTSLYIDVICRTIGPSLEMEMTNDADIDKSGTIASVVDLKNASIIVKQFTIDERAHIKPTGTTISMVGGRYELVEPDFKQTAKYNFVATLGERVSSNTLVAWMGDQSC